MTRNKIQNNGKAFCIGFMLIANAIPASAQETVEIRYTKDGVSHTVEVDRDIRQLDLSNIDNSGNNDISSITLPNGLTNLRWLHLAGNQLTNLALPRGLTNLEVLVLRSNDLTSLTLPEGLTNLKILNLSGNPRLTNLALPRGLTNLGLLFFSSYGLTSLTLAEDTALGFTGIDADRGLAYNLKVSCRNVPLRKVILPKRLDGKVSFRGMEDDVYDNLEFIFFEDLRSPKITRAGDALEITWAVGVLQISAGIEGPWKDIRASSPLRIFPRPSLPAEFFRVRAE